MHKSMQALGAPEIIGIGTVAAGFGVLVWRMWQAHTDLTKRVIDVVEKNAQSDEKLSSALKAVDRSVQENTSVTKATKDGFNSLLVELLRRDNHAQHSRPR